MKIGKKKIRLFLIVILIVLIFLIGIFYFTQVRENQSSSEQYSYTNVINNMEIEYNGKTYRYNPEIQTILLMGVDTKEALKGKDKYGEAGRVDSLYLLVLNQDEKSIKILPISRDTITKVDSFSVEGYKKEPIETHLAFAFAFGDGGTESCINTCNAVSTLLMGVTIDDYIASNLDNLTLLNRIVGGVEVVVPNNDVAHLHPELQEGTVTTLTDSNAYDFLHYRNTDKDFSNKGRMERGTAFLKGFINRLKKLTDNQLKEIWEKLDKKGGNILTSIKDEEFLEMISDLKSYDLESQMAIINISGTNSIEEGYDVFYPDQNELKKLVIDTFYVEK